MSNRILIVDDSSYVADAFARLISRCGYDVRTVYSGRAAIHETIAFRPDMVLMDICMPDQDGYETARQIRNETRNAQIMLVAVTCLAQTQDAQRAYDSGFNLHVPKPVGLGTLYGLLATLNRTRGQCGSAGSLVGSNCASLRNPSAATAERESPWAFSCLESQANPDAETALSLTDFETMLDGILAAKLPAAEQREAVEKLFTQYAATLPNYRIAR